MEGDAGHGVFIRIPLPFICRVRPRLFGQKTARHVCAQKAANDEDVEVFLFLNNVEVL